MDKDAQLLTQNEDIFNALLTFWGSAGYKPKNAKKLDSNNGKNLNLSQIESITSKILEMDINKARHEIAESSYELAGHISREFLNQTFSNFLSSKSTTRVFIKVVKANLNSEDEIRPDTYMSFCERHVDQYEEMLKCPMVFACPGTGNYIGREHFGYLVLKVNPGFPVVETKGLCDKDEILISSNELINSSCEMTFIPGPIEDYPEDDVEHHMILKRIKNKLIKIFQ